MARRGRSTRGQRDTPDIATLDHLVLTPTVFPTIAPLSPLSDPWETLSQDRRFFHPDQPFQEATYFSGVPASVSERRTRSITRVVGRAGKPIRGTEGRKYRYPAFNHPSNVAVCVRRRQRREVLFALKRARGSGGRRRRNYQSEVRC